MPTPSHTNDPDDDKSEYELPIVQKTNEPIDEEQSIAEEARRLQAGNAAFSRKDVRYYMRVRSNNAEARNFLLTLLEAHYAEVTEGADAARHETLGLLLSQREREESFNMTNAELEEMFQLDVLMKAEQRLQACV